MHLLPHQIWVVTTIQRTLFPHPPQQMWHSNPEECSAEVFKDTTHHLEQLAEDNPQDDLFEKVKSHRWDNGILLLEIEWKTGKTSSSPFTCEARLPICCHSIHLRQQRGDVGWKTHVRQVHEVGSWFPLTSEPYNSSFASSG